MFTQPLMYKTISKHRTTRTIYADKLVAEGILDAETAQRLLMIALPIWMPSLRQARITVRTRLIGWREAGPACALRTG